MVVGFFLSGCGESTKYKIRLEVWGVFDDSDAYGELFNQYRDINPFISSIEYRKLSPDTYKEDLLNALAAGNGPDIFMIRNTWTDSFRDKIIPAPPTLLTEKTFRDAFVDVAAEDFLGKDTLAYAMPLSVDSLALYYNKDLFNAAGITEPPKTWEELLGDVPRLTRIDAYGNITQSAIALGTADNINRSPDILLALARQYAIQGSERGVTAQSFTQALDFYTRFARFGSPEYTWNVRQHYSIDAFYEGTAAMMINYSWQIPTLRQKNAKFNFGVVPLPQFQGARPENLANYWGLAVAKNKTLETGNVGSNTSVPAGRYSEIRVHEAWQLLKFLTLPHPAQQITVTNVLSGNAKNFPLVSDPTALYLEKTGKPAARRDLVEAQKGDVFLSPFALGNLVAGSWEPGNPEAAETIIADGVGDVNRGERSVSDVASTVWQRILKFKE